MVACGPMPVTAIPIRDGTIEAYPLGGGDGIPLVVLGGVETGFRPLGGTESVLDRRWSERGERRSVTVLGRPIPDDPADAELVMHPRVMADGVAAALATLGLGPVAIEAESGPTALVLSRQNLPVLEGTADHAGGRGHTS